MDDIMLATFRQGVTCERFSLIDCLSQIFSSNQSHEIQYYNTIHCLQAYSIEYEKTATNEDSVLTTLKTYDNVHVLVGWIVASIPSSGPVVGLDGLL